MHHAWAGSENQRYGGLATETTIDKPNQQTEQRHQPNPNQHTTERVIANPIKNEDRRNEQEKKAAGGSRLAANQTLRGVQLDAIAEVEDLKVRVGCGHLGFGTSFGRRSSVSQTNPALLNTSTDQDGHVFYHGAMIGVEVMW